MSVKKQSVGDARVNVDRWLISYADFITLMFSFFVVMFAAAYDSDDSRAQSLAKAISTAFTLNVFQHGGTQVFGRKMYAMNEGTVLDRGTREAMTMSENRGDVERQKDLATNNSEKFESVSAMRDQLTQEFYNELKKHNITATLESRGLVVSFTGVAYFDEGSDAIRPETRGLIEKILRVMKGRRNFVQVEGHSDGTGKDVDGHNSNMALSVKRAQTVTKLLTQEYGVPEEYVSTAGYGPFRPLGDNRVAGGRAKNRRVDLVLLKTVPDASHMALPRVNPNERAKTAAAEGLNEESP